MPSGDVHVQNHLLENLLQPREGLSILQLGAMQNRLRRTVAHRNLKLDPEHIGAQTNLANTYLKKGDFDHAIEHYKAVSALQPKNKEIAYILSAISQPQQIPKEAPAEYLEHLFDQYAPHYDEHLTKQLQYQAPQLLYRAVTKVAGTEETDWTVLDLGCGTGLSGAAFRTLAKRLVGIDISSKMIEMAQKRELYDELAVSDIKAALKKYRDVDLILAADTFIYVGDLKPIFKLARKALRKKGLFAFTVEQADDNVDYVLQRTARYAHSRPYIESLIKKYRFTTEHCDIVVTRQQMRHPVTAYLFVVRS